MTRLIWATMTEFERNENEAGAPATEEAEVRGRKTASVAVRAGTPGRRLAPHVVFQRMVGVYLPMMLRSRAFDSSNVSLTGSMQPVQSCLIGNSGVRKI